GVHQGLRQPILPPADQFHDQPGAAGRGQLGQVVAQPLGVLREGDIGGQDQCPAAQQRCYVGYFRDVHPANPVVQAGAPGHHSGFAAAQLRQLEDLGHGRQRQLIRRCQAHHQPSRTRDHERVDTPYCSAAENKTACRWCQVVPRDDTEPKADRVGDVMSDNDLLARHRAVMPDWLSLYYEQPIEIVSGSGRHVTDADGNTYLDFFAGILTNAIGYDIPEISDAIRKQVDTGILHTSTLYLIRNQVELAERIASLSGMKNPKVFFTNSGTEANESALLLATQHRRSNQILALRNSYHGRSFAAMGVTGNRGWSASSLSPVKVSYVHGGYRYRSPFRDFSDADYIAACTDDLRQVIETTTSGDVACMIVEPIQGVGGFATPPDGLFAAFAEVLDEYGIPLISDEV